jgi:hypothetical protein
LQTNHNIIIFILIQINKDLYQLHEIIIWVNNNFIYIWVVHKYVKSEHLQLVLLKCVLILVKIVNYIKKHNLSTVSTDRIITIIIHPNITHSKNINYLILNIILCNHKQKMLVNLYQKLNNSINKDNNYLKKIFILKNNWIS